MRVSISHPERMDIAGPGGAVTHGADQDWFPGLWQRRAGCGPTAAALICAYLAQTRPALAPLYPEAAMERGPFTAHMERVWQFVTPSSHGLHRPEWMARGMAAYAASRGAALSPALLDFPGAATKRPPWEAVEAFVARSLELDCPVAFLNLHNGVVKALDSWHWVTLTALEDGRADLLDSGEKLTVDLRLWYQTTRRRGGFVSALGDGA